MKQLTWILFGTLALLGCNNPENKPADSKPVDKKAAAAEAKNGATAAPLIIDVRSQDEWDGGHLKSAVHIPHTDIGDKIAQHAKSKDQKIVLYCRSGGRAGKALNVLKDMGYTNVENAGGYEDVKGKYE